MGLESLEPTAQGECGDHSGFGVQIIQEPNPGSNVSMVRISSISSGFRCNPGTGTRKRQVFCTALMQRAGETAQRVAAADGRHISPVLFASYGSSRCPEDHTGSDHGLEAQHRPHSPLDGAVILFDGIVQVGTLPDPDWLQLASRPILPCSGLSWAWSIHLDQAACRLIAASANWVSNSSVFFSSCSVCSSSLAASLMPSCVAQVLSVP